MKSSGKPSAEVNRSMRPVRRWSRFSPLGVPIHRSPPAPPASERMTLLDRPSAVVRWAKPLLVRRFNPAPSVPIHSSPWALSKTQRTRLPESPSLVV